VLIGQIVAPCSDIALGLVGGDEEGQQRPGRARTQRRWGTGDRYPDRRAWLALAIVAVERGGHGGRVRLDVTVKVTGIVTRTSPARRILRAAAGWTSLEGHRDITVAGQGHVRAPDRGDLRPRRSTDSSPGADELPGDPGPDPPAEQPR